MPLVIFPGAAGAGRAEPRSSWLPHNGTRRSIGEFIQTATRPRFPTESPVRDLLGLALNGGVRHPGESLDPLEQSIQPIPSLRTEMPLQPNLGQCGSRIEGRRLTH